MSRGEVTLIIRLAVPFLYIHVAYELYLDGIC